MAGSKITAEAIKKAEEILGLTSTEKTADQIAAEQAAELKKAEDLKKADELKKATEAEDIKTQFGELMKKAEELAAKAKDYNIELSHTLVGNPQGGAIEAQGMPMVKAVEDKIAAQSTLYQAAQEKIEILEKGLGDIQAFNKQLSERFLTVEKQPLDRKSISGAKAIERFEKGGDAAGNGLETLSISKASDRTKLTDSLFSACEAKQFKDPEFEKAIQYIEMTKSLGSDARFAEKIQRRLAQELKINIVN